MFRDLLGRVVVMVEIVDHGFDCLDIFDIQIPVELIWCERFSACTSVTSSIGRKRNNSSLAFQESVWATSRLEEF